MHAGLTIVRRTPCQYAQVLWFNMREEPVVYINGLPFVLREQQRPMKNLQEYAGIDAERLERMEARLKQDVLAEAGMCYRQGHGSALVAHCVCCPVWSAFICSQRCCALR
jgi:hypothetical protein